MSTNQTSGLSTCPAARAGLRIVASLLVALVGVAAALAQTRDAAAIQTVDPAYTHSWYIDSVDVGAIQYLGQIDGQWDGAGNHCGFGDNSSRDKIVVLAFGKSINLYGYGAAYRGYGTQLVNKPGQNQTNYLTDEDIAYRVEQYAEQYFWNSGGSGGCSQTRVAIGTNNSFLCESSPGGYCSAYDAGWEWSNVVTNVENWLQARGYTSRVNARAASDIETYGGDGWHCAGDSTDFVNGFADNPGGNAILDFGDAWTSGGCWTEQQVRYVTTGRANFFGLPETYTQNQLCVYTDGCGGAIGIERDTGAIEFKGQMTQCLAGDTIPHDYCPANDTWTPWQGWNNLWSKQFQFFSGGQGSLPFSTNINYQ
jgi:hypothetical protein